MNPPAVTAAGDDAVRAEKTMELLWSRVRQRGDLPGFSKVISAIIAAIRDDDDREFNMTKTVLQDPALTQKVLRLANSAMYSVFGQNINTVSKAVIVLGTEAIGHLALGLKLIDGLSNASSDSTVARLELEKAVFAGHVARHMTSAASTRDAEEAVVCSMLHSLGRMLVTFYLPERWQQMQARLMDTGIDEARAAMDVFGLGLDDIGRQVAQQWGLPAAIVKTLHDVSPMPVEEPLEHSDWLAAISTLSSRCADALCVDQKSSATVLHKLAAGYADMVGLDVEQVLSSVEAAQRSVAEEDLVVLRPATVGKVSLAASVAGKPGDAALILAHGVEDVRDAMKSASTTQLLTMALETVYQGLGFSRVVAFLRNQERQHYSARMCFGDDVQELLPRLVFGDAYQPDVFHASLANDKMVFVENAQDPAFLNKVPRWWREALPNVRSFMVLPLAVNRQPIGFIYGDWDVSRPAARIEQSEIPSLNELRMLVMRAFELRRQMEPGWARTML